MGALKRSRNCVASFASECVVCLAAALVWTLPAHAQTRVIEDIRVTADDDEAVIVIEFACEMRFVADTPTQGGALLEVRVAPFDSCRQQGISSTIASESYLPIGAETAHLVEIEYSSLGLGDSVVMLTFDQVVEYQVRQRATLREVEIVVDLAGADPEETDPSRPPISVRLVETAVTQDFMINLQSTREPASADIVESVVTGEGNQLYVSQIRVDGDIWYRLRLGFFASESAAEAALLPLVAAFPRAWIGRAEPAEIALARENAVRVGSGEIAQLTAEQLGEPSGDAIRSAIELDADEIAPMMQDARSKLLAGDHAAAIERYRLLAQTPGEHRAEAVEFLGVAYERDARVDRARIEYQQYLREFPDSPAASRVRQRLSALNASQQGPRESLREARSDGEDWDFAAGLSQYYRRDDNQFDEDQPEVTTRSALLTDADFSMRRAGERFDMSARISFSHYRDLLDSDEGGRGDQNRTSYAYFDLAESGQQWDLRIGRQSLHSFGVLGRFDGAHFSYGLGDDKRVHVVQGFPVESTRDSVETDREFTGLAVEFPDLLGSWDVSAFLNTQSIEGVDARKAVGTEARYFDERRTLTAMLDYDIDFSELNMVLVLGTWRLPNRMTFSALIDQRRSPILTTRNALIGQPVQTIDELLLVWTEAEVRALARDRTSDSQTVTLGLAKPLGERLQLNFDMTRSEIDGTVASGGVSAVPGTGPQTYYSVSLVGTGLLASSDVNIWNLRVGDADTFKTRLLTWDARFPIGSRLRINPRIRFVYWEGVSNRRERTTVAPALRFLLNLRGRYRLEFELGRDRTTRTDAGSEREATANYFNLGYRASF